MLLNNKNMAIATRTIEETQTVIGSAACLQEKGEKLEKPNEKEAEQVYFDINKLDEYFKNIPKLDVDYYECNSLYGI
jgi:hypothetical protein